jgi:hypothetical protein
MQTINHPALASSLKYYSSDLHTKLSNNLKEQAKTTYLKELGTSRRSRNDCFENGSVPLFYNTEIDIIMNHT